MDVEKGTRTINWQILDNNFKLYGFERINGGKDRICIYKLPDSFELNNSNENKDDLDTVILDDDDVDSLCDFNHEDGLLSVNLNKDLLNYN